MIRKLAATLLEILKKLLIAGLREILPFGDEMLKIKSRLKRLRELTIFRNISIKLWLLI